MSVPFAEPGSGAVYACIMNVGILGGTFDPVHLGHLVLAEQARDQLSLDEVLFVPAGDPWRKSSRTITPPEHRLAMLRLAIEGNDAFGISDLELRREGPTYTAVTLAELAAERLDDAFWFIMGADALADLPNWRDPEHIVRHAMLAVAPREAQEVNVAQLNMPALAGRVALFDCPRIDISSTDVRARIAAGCSVRYMVPEPVAAYISTQGLYR
jgi:nicotinate-nucleotide adenylyltransferase